MKLTLLPSDKGDCMLLESPDKTTILIDGGMPSSYVEHVREFLGKWRAKNKRPLDLVYLSHIDQDHVGGVLQMMNDLVDWRVFDHKKKNKPDFLRPPEVKRLWHNGFHDIAGKNAGEIGSMLAARAAQLTASTNPIAQNLGADYQAIAASIPESIKLSRRVSAKQLKIPLNGEFGGKFAMVRSPTKTIRLKGPASPQIRVLGPFKKDLEQLRKMWNDWLDDQKNKASLEKTRKFIRDEDQRFDFATTVALDINDELGHRKEVTEQNLASLMLLIERNNKRIVLTGDGHHEDIIAGLEHNGLMAPGQGLHVDVLKIQHHGSENNLDRDFAKRITADHYVICGNGRHENPDLRVLTVLCESRLGTNEQKSKNPQVDNKFKVWFNCSTDFLQKEIAKRKKEKRPFREWEKAEKHFIEIEKKMKKFQAKPGGRRMTLRYLKGAPLVLDLEN